MFGLRTAEVIQKTNNGLKQLDEELSPKIVRARLGSVTLRDGPFVSQIVRACGCKLQKC